MEWLTHLLFSLLVPVALGYGIYKIFGKIGLYCIIADLLFEMFFSWLNCKENACYPFVVELEQGFHFTYIIQVVVALGYIFVKSRPVYWIDD